MNKSTLNNYTHFKQQGFYPFARGFGRLLQLFRHFRRDEPLSPAKWHMLLRHVNTANAHQTFNDFHVLNDSRIFSHSGFHAHLRLRTWSFSISQWTAWSNEISACSWTRRSCHLLRWANRACHVAVG